MHPVAEQFLLERYEFVCRALALLQHQRLLHVGNEHGREKTVKIVPVCEIRRIAENAYHLPVPEPFYVFATDGESVLTDIKQALRGTVTQQHDRLIARYAKDPLDIVLASVIA